MGMLCRMDVELIHRGQKKGRLESERSDRPTFTCSLVFRSAGFRWFQASAATLTETVKIPVPRTGYERHVVSHGEKRAKIRRRGAPLSDGASRRFPLLEALREKKRVREVLSFFF